jgi:signal recognition particle subunit SEC65
MKLMLKVFVVMVSLAGLMFFFLSKYVAGDRNEVATEIPLADSTTGLYKLAFLPRAISESSGIEVLQQGRYITHNDAGNSNRLFEINDKGELLNSIKLNVPNVDWEDMTRDNKGNIYIADTGNNDNDRKELAVYKVSTKDLANAAAIRFKYEDQEKYPPSKKDRNFDSEAIFWSDGQLYIISKDRGQKQTAKLYQLPDQPGSYKAKLIGKIDFKGQVTGAAISPDGSTILLLEEQKLTVYSDFKDINSFYKGKSKTIDLEGTGQTEAVAFEDNKTLVITSEGGSLFRYKF